MSAFKKFMVVPYLNRIEKNDESSIADADSKMTEIINDPNTSDDLKIKIYHQNLNKFLLKYNPDTYGVTPAISKLVQAVTDFVEKNRESKEIVNKIKQEPFVKEEISVPIYTRICLRWSKKS